MDEHINTPQSKHISIAAKVVIIVIVLALVGWIASMIASPSKDSKVEATIFTYHVVNPSLLSVEYRVTNTTDAAGISSCAIKMNDESMEYTGSDFGFESAKEIQPGEAYSGVASLPISKEGAEHITEGSITCRIE